MKKEKEKPAEFKEAPKKETKNEKAKPTKKK